MPLQIGPQVAWQIVDGEAVVVDLESGVTIGLNPTATFIWSNLAGREESDLAAATAEHFGISGDEAASDVREFLAELRQRALIVEREGPLP